MQNSNNNESTNVYTLNKKTMKNGSFVYTVTDQSGNVISTRSSKRNYVAATITGSYYFGRLDLIGKGDHGRFGGCKTPIAYLATEPTIDTPTPEPTPEPTPALDETTTTAIAPLYVGQFVTYTNCASTYTGEIVKIDGRNIVVIDDAAGMSLWNAGHSVGSCIVAEQIKQTHDTDPRLDPTPVTMAQLMEIEPENMIIGGIYDITIATSKRVIYAMEFRGVEIENDGVTLAVMVSRDGEELNFDISMIDVAITDMNVPDDVHALNNRAQTWFHGLTMTGKQIASSLYNFDGSKSITEMFVASFKVLKTAADKKRRENTPAKLERKYFHIHIINVLRGWDFYIEHFGNLTDADLDAFMIKTFPYAKTHVGYKIESHEISRTGYISATN